MNAVVQYLQAHRETFVAELTEYLRIPSISAQREHERDVDRCSRWIETRCRRAGLRAKRYSGFGHPVVLARTPGFGKRKCRHFLVYGHYDVQPPDPLDLWDSPPFEPRRKDGCLFARGASDNKGQHFAHLKAVEAFLRTQTPLPVELAFLIEGEEEIGSAHLGAFVKEHRAELRVAGVVISDSGMPSLQHPALTYGLRGVAGCEVKLTGPSRDLHSGIYGGAVDNPAMVLCQLLGQLRDGEGRVAIPGFYDAVAELSPYEREQFKRLPESAAKLKRHLGVPALYGEAGFSSIERRTARPTVEINGLTSGYQQEGSKTIVPAWAMAKLSFRLVPDQSARRILRLAARHLKAICPKTVRLHFEAGHCGDAYLTSPDGADAKAALRALRRAFHHEPVLMREGGSIPIVNEFQRRLGVDTLLLGLGLPDDNVHSPNEKLSLEALDRGMLMSAYLWEELGKSGARVP